MAKARNADVAIKASRMATPFRDLDDEWNSSPAGVASERSAKQAQFSKGS
jgi:hypothetical protein